MRSIVSKPLFELGSVTHTPGAKAALDEAKQEPWEFLERHQHGDWGDVCTQDWQENELSLREGFRVFSSYKTNAGVKLWVITEADRSLTTIFLPEEH